ncbi:hypothetical protein KTT_30690 [Tengunoibacter tsumagoiensis]|uniref:Uncharacterized protein n=1 Tax=Tengunoibacter tsumagoiensis TaxID=2014871 RepID=A0A402A239_9CHLR|nr:hypothetical protein KTT_30690 [Tengunoibacter tsumagoiensis]
MDKEATTAPLPEHFSITQFFFVGFEDTLPARDLSTPEKDLFERLEETHISTCGAMDRYHITLAQTLLMQAFTGGERGYSNSDTSK